MQVALCVNLTKTCPELAREARVSAEVDLHRGIVETVLDGIITIDEHGTVESFNPAAEHIFGYRADEVIGHNVKLLMTEPHVQRHDTYLQRYCTTGQARIIGTGREVQGRRKDGTFVRIHLGVSAFQSPAGRRFVGLIRDLTEQRTAERQRDRFFSMSRDLLCTANFEGFFVTVNDAWTEALGWERHELLAHAFTERIHPDDVERTTEELAGLARGEATQRFVNRYRHKEGCFHWLDWTAVSVPDEGLIYASARDVSAAKEVERLKDEFISAVSHELRTPLASILGSLRLVEGGAAGALPAQAAHLVQIASRNSARLNLLIDDILDIEMIATGQAVKLKLADHALNALVEAALESNQAYGDLHGVSFACTPSSEQLLVHVDADRFQQVMANLLSNAAKFSPRGSVVEVRVLRRDALARVLVDDQGSGIPAEFRDHVFTRFSRAADASQVSGTGLGLAISKSLVELFGGTIGFQPSSRGGTTFFIDLPAQEEGDHA